MNKLRPSDIAALRLYHQQVSVQKFKTPAEVVSWMGITQAQDYAGAKWSVALRLHHATDTDIEDAIAGKSIVRSWSFRGTLHFMSPACTRMALQIAAPRVLQTMSSNLRRFGLDKPTLSKAMKIMAATLRDGKHRSRKELMAAIQKKGISTESLRSNFFMLCAALDGLICCGVRRGKEFTYTLLDEWLPATPKTTRHEALATFAHSYFQSHSPATLHDLAWWMGITLADAKAAVEMIEDQLTTVTVNSINYYLPAGMPVVKPAANSIYLLPGFDEYLLGYKDRSLVLSPANAKLVVGSGNGLYSATIVANGQVAGVWKRTVNKAGIDMETNLFTPLSKAQSKALDKAANDYCRYMELPLRSCT